MKQKVLIVEDEANISMVLKAFLAKAGFLVEQAYNGEQAVSLFESGKPSLVLLDITLPVMDGWTVLKRIRQVSSCPVIMLTALSDINYRIEGLNSGADDYLSKPFVGDEVVARIRAVLRRMPQVATENAALFGGLKVDYNASEIALNGKPVHLTPRDLSLLLFLTRHPNQTFDRDQLIESVWGMDYVGSDRAVDMAIKRIRQSLAGWSSEEGDIVTFKRLGYQFRVKSAT
ncbi:response regulator transcription factor [Cohnella fermenti]|uniref:Response regulator transcription factor n=1 Tax=Cohnella fermenti TaxID=2565925 RepID=A0A4S4BKS4_9BACL|nr:response regulator transcription factor [Cohnella fermenti]THF75334.1 response regulator transcription factor [Cohnella fermenti]